MKTYLFLTLLVISINSEFVTDSYFAGCDVYEPVCGVDGITYDNPCSCSQDNVGIAYTGECDKTLVVQSACDDLDYVCGEDNTTYDNSCDCKRNDVVVAYPGECKKQVVVSELCPQEWKPVCGDDGLTYASECCCRAQLKSIRHKRPCGNFYEDDYLVVSSPKRVVYFDNYLDN